MLRAVPPTESAQVFNVEVPLDLEEKIIVICGVLSVPFCPAYYC